MRYRYRSDEELKDSGVEWIGKIPKDWETLKLKRITQSVKNGIWGDDEQHNSDDIQCIRILNFDRNKMQVNIDDLTVRNIPKEKQKGYLLNKGDLLIEKSGGGEKNPVGFVAIYNHTLPAVYANFMAKISLNDKADSSYIRYICSNIYNKRIHMDSVNQTTGIQNLDTERYFSRVIAIPNIKEQEKIANFLDKKTSQFDSIISKKEQLIERLEEAKKSLISEVVTGKVKVVKTDDGYELIKRSSEEMKDSGVKYIGYIPKYWKLSRIKNFTTLKSIKNKPSLELLSLYRDYGVVPKNSRDDNNNRPSEDLSGYKYVQINDLVLNKMKVWQGSLAVSEYEGIVSPAYIICGIDSKIMQPRYVHYLLRNKLYIPEYRRLSTGIRPDQWDISYDNFKNISALIPSIEEQNNVVEYLDNKLIDIENLVINIKQQIEKLKEAKQSLISEAVTGKIEILD